MSFSEVITSAWSTDFSLDFGQFDVTLNPAMGITIVKGNHGGAYEDRAFVERMIDENDIALILLSQ